MLCHRCQLDKTEDNFRPVSRYYAAREKSLWCKTCANEYQRNYIKLDRKINPDKYAAQKRRARLKNYGLSDDKFIEIVSAQNGLCAICKGPPPLDRPLFVDHSHSTGNIRGLLCRRCNTLIGLAEDNCSILGEAITYLTRSIK